MKIKFLLPDILKGAVVSMLCSFIFLSCWDNFSGDFLGKSEIAPEIIITDGEIDSTTFWIGWSEPDVETFSGMKITCSNGDEVTVFRGTTNNQSDKLVLTAGVENRVTVTALYSSGYKIEILKLGITPPSSQKDFILIYTVDQLKDVANGLDDIYTLMSDIDVSGENNWIPIGTSGNHFTGIFDGNNHKINGLKIDDSANDYKGLFGYTNNGVIKNLTVNVSSINGRYYIGGLAGYVHDTEINNCHTTGSIAGNGYVGGLVGYFYSAYWKIANCSFSGNVSGTGNCVGGLVGYIYFGLSVTRTNILNCHTYGSVSGDTHVGGIIGLNQTPAIGNTIANCFSASNVTGNTNTGGIIGYYYCGVSDIDNILNCYCSGNVSGNTYTGGFIGQAETFISDPNYMHMKNCYSSGHVAGSGATGGFAGDYVGTMTSCYYDMDTSGRSDNDGRGSPRSTSQMKTQSTFSGWNFSGIWSIDSSVNDGYPYLKGMAP